MAHLPADKLAQLKRAFTDDAMQPTQAPEKIGLTYATAKRNYELWSDEIKCSLDRKLLPSLHVRILNERKRDRLYNDGGKPAGHATSQDA
ncbi:MAG TPA: hypothetical protein VGK48_22350 [Terriglobia bacterium]|jgi:hypothetical protein